MYVNGNVCVYIRAKRKINSTECEYRNMKIQNIQRMYLFIHE